MQPTLEKPTQEQTTNPINELPASMANLGEAFAAGPPPQNQVPPLPIEPPKKSNKKWLILLVLVLLIAGALVPIFMLTKKETKQPQSITPAPVVSNSTQETPYLFIADYQKRNAILADSTGKQIYSTPVNGAPSYEASSPGKQVLVSTYDNNTQLSTYILLDKEGKALTVNPAVQKLLDNKANINRSFTMLEDNVVIAAICVSANTNNACKIIQINLLTGDQKTLLDAAVPSPFATGESIFNIINTSSDHKLIYLHVGGPTKLGTSEEAIYSFDPSTSQATLVYEFPKDRNVDNPSLSPDNKKLIYDVQGVGSAEGSATIYSVNLNTKKENSTNWDKIMPGDGLPFVWSQDSKKASFGGYKEVTGQISSLGPLTLAYLDFDQNKITSIKTIEDSSKQYVERLYWLDNSTLVYSIDVSTAYHDFSNSTGQTYKQGIASSDSTKINAPAGHLDQLLLW